MGFARVSRGDEAVQDVATPPLGRVVRLKQGRCLWGCVLCA